MSVLGELVDRMRELAAEELDTHTLELRAFDDGDYHLRIFHTHPIINGNIEERTEIRYDREDEVIIRRYYRRHKLEQDLLEEETDVLESYSDPIK